MNDARRAPWWRDVTRAQWKTLVAAQVGWMLDAMDVMLYAVALAAIKKEFGLDDATPAARRVGHAARGGGGRDGLRHPRATGSAARAC